MPSEYEYLFKLLLVGDVGVGKSSVVCRYTDGSFAEDYRSTVGVDFKIRSISVNRKSVKLQIWDTAGQERFRTITKSYYRGAKGVFIVYDVTKRESFEHVGQWMEAVREHSGADVEISLVGNKCDLSTDRAVTHDEAKSLADSLGIVFVETSAKSAQGIGEAFETMALKLLEKVAAAPSPIDVPVYGPPPLLRSEESRLGCCHHLGPPGDAFHYGSSKDRDEVMTRSRGLEAIHEWREVSAGLDSESVDLTATLARAVREGLPVVIRNGHQLLSAEATAELLPEALMRRFGHRALPIAQLRSDGCSVPPFRTSSIRLGKFLACSLGRPTDDASRKCMYLQQLPVQQHLPELGHLGLPVQGPEALREAIGESILVTCTLFCGAAGVMTSLHFDRGDYALAEDRGDALSSIDNLFLQLSGRKRFKLFRPCDHGRLYARGASDPSAPHVSQIEDILDVDAKKFPLFHEAFARSFEVELGPGDALLVPRWWWHQSIALSDGHAVNWWFETCEFG